MLTPFQRRCKRNPDCLNFIDDVSYCGPIYAVSLEGSKASPARDKSPYPFPCSTAVAETCSSMANTRLCLQPFSSDYDFLDCICYDNNARDDLSGCIQCTYAYKDGGGKWLAKQYASSADGHPDIQTIYDICSDY